MLLEFLCQEAAAKVLASKRQKKGQEDQKEKSEGGHKDREEKSQGGHGDRKEKSEGGHEDRKEKSDRPKDKPELAEKNVSQAGL